MANSVNITLLFIVAVSIVVLTGIARHNGLPLGFATLLTVFAFGLILFAASRMGDQYSIETPRPPEQWWRQLLYLDPRPLLSRYWVMWTIAVVLIFYMPDDHSLMDDMLFGLTLTCFSIPAAFKPGGMQLVISGRRYLVAIFVTFVLGALLKHGPVPLVGSGLIAGAVAMAVIGIIHYLYRPNHAANEGF